MTVPYWICAGCGKKLGYVKSKAKLAMIKHKEECKKPGTKIKQFKMPILR